MIVGMFRVDPRERPTIADLIDRLEEMAEVRKVRLADPIPAHIIRDTQMPPSSGE